MGVAQDFGITIDLQGETTARPWWKFVLERFDASCRFAESRATC